MPNPIIIIIFGAFVGVFSGLMGLGGGAVMIPILVLALGIEQASAQGISLAAMIPPVMLPAVIGYYRAGKLSPNDLWIAAFIAIGFAMGSYFGSKLAVEAAAKGILSAVFGFILIYVASYSIFGKQHLTRTLLLSLLMVAITGAIFATVKWYDARQATNQNETQK